MNLQNINLARVEMFNEIYKNFLHRFADGCNDCCEPSIYRTELSPENIFVRINALNRHKTKLTSIDADYRKQSDSS